MQQRFSKSFHVPSPVTDYAVRLAAAVEHVTQQFVTQLRSGVMIDNSQPELVPRISLSPIIIGMDMRLIQNAQACYRNTRDDLVTLSVEFTDN